MATSPSLASSPTGSLLEWDELAVHGFFVNTLNLQQYEDLVYEHGITGDVLSAMDHTALSDMGMASLGHRLKLLRAVWEVKKDQGIQVDEDEWKPADVPAEGRHVAQGEIDRLWDVINEQQERLLNLERDHVRILNALEENGITVPMASSSDGDGMRGVATNRGDSRRAAAGGQGLGVGNILQSGSRWRDHGGSLSDGEDYGSGPSRAARRTSRLFPSSLAASTSAVPHTSDSATFESSFTPTPVNSTITFDAPSPQPDRDRQTRPAPPPLNRLISAGSLANTNLASPPANTPPAAAQAHLQPGRSSNAAGSSYAAAPVQNGHVAGAGGSSSHQTSTSGAAASASSAANANAPNAAAGPSDSSKAKAKDDASRAARSFRVTLEDPCFKVLPAALKKYKINDDWKQYALFICFGSTERCLSYDEKPLMLFQKLKESGQKPVFMLRHIRDIRNPIAVAQQKQAIKLGLSPNSTADVLPKIKPTTDTSVSPTKPSGLQPRQVQREDGQTPVGGAFPELPSPGLRDGDATAANKATPAGGHGTLVDNEGNVRDVTYAVAIYPYIADRQDEFDVAVGATFVILSKAKGWYIVQKDPDGIGKIIPDQALSGWVPAGCLLELSSPISVVSPAATESVPAYPGLLPLTPSAVMSSSYPGLALMDYEAKGEGELSLGEGDMVKVYKKYCHWSYTIRTDTGERGWVPAWFIGKISSGTGPGGGDSVPSTATAHPRTAEPSASATAGGGAEGDGDEIQFDGQGAAALNGASMPDAGRAERADREARGYL